MRSAKLIAAGLTAALVLGSAAAVFADETAENTGSQPGGSQQGAGNTAEGAPADPFPMGQQPEGQREGGPTQAQREPAP